jgi:hypothetical protein
MMTRTTLNFVLDAVSFATLLGLTFTGFIMKYILPPGSGGGHGYRGGRGGAEAAEPIKQFWALGRHDWGDVHFYLAVLFVVLMVLHLVLHWRWIQCYVKSIFRR